MVFAEHALQHDVKLEVGGYEVIKTYVALGLGVSIVMSHCLTGEEPLHTAPVRRWFPRRSYGLVMRKGRPLSAAAQQFIHTVCPDL
jgi:DNA-binding transcriptional LysR family regulator